MAKAYLTPNGWRKTCCTCKQEFTLENFHKSSGTPDGLARPCRACCYANVKKTEKKRIDAGLGRISDEAKQNRIEGVRRSYAENPEKYRERSRLNRQNNRESVGASAKKSRAKKQEYYREFARLYYHKNKDVIGPRNREQSMRRYINQELATPPWADRSSILEIYKKAHELTSSTGVKHQVDHIVPITSKLVCGLHVQNNLQILDKIENIKKGNRMWPGHPDPKRDIKRVAEAEQGVYLPSKRRDAIDAVNF